MSKEQKKFQPHTPGPWHVGKRPNGQCRIYSASSGHAIARTYGTDLNGIGVCALTGPENESDAQLIAQAPALLEIALDIISLAQAIEAGECKPADNADPFFRHIVSQAIAAAANTPGKHRLAIP